MPTPSFTDIIKAYLEAQFGGDVPPIPGITIDSELSTTSENPVQNKVITAALALKAHEEWEESGEAESQSNTASGSSTDHDVAGYNDSEALPTASRDNTGVYQESSGRNSGSNSREGHTYGNIGVTTSAQMIQGEIETRMMFNYAKIISDMFKTEFCIMVY